MLNYIEAFNKLKNYCEKEEFKGYDPFDGLNSILFKSVPIINKNRFAKLAWLQFFKRSPINFRKLAGVKKDYNPKGLGLFLQGYCNLYQEMPEKDYLDKINLLIGLIKQCVSKGYAGTCWGYNFDWQARAFFQPKGMPSVVVTSFIACALLDAFEITGDQDLIKMARSACDFVLTDLNRFYDADGDFAFSYCPVDNTQVFNASLLGTRLLCRVYAHTKEDILLAESKKAVSFACKWQQPNGAWAYSPLPFHAWIDNFHTGYNLECIYTYQQISGDKSFNKYLEKGFEYYINTFFEDDGLPKYYNNKKYPIDMHNTAQLVITLYKLGRLKEHKHLADRVVQWSIDNMFNARKGYFYYYKEKWFTVNIPYIRWIQAWMFVGLSYYKLFNKNEKD